jgi:branched-chain amino acid transport system permease protein
MNWDTIFSVSVESAIGTSAVIYTLAAIGINVQFGYTGLLNFGQAAFMAVGAYGLAIGVATWGLNFWLSVGIGLAAAVALALILGVPTLRLRADYLAIVTIAAAEIFRITVRTSNYRDVTGGTDGLQQFSGAFFDINPYGRGEYGIGPVSFDERTTWVLTIGWILVALCCSVVYLLMRSPWGGCSRRSARMRTRYAAWARTSSRTRCSRSSWAASSARSPGSSSRFRPARSRQTATRPRSPSSRTPL